MDAEPRDESTHRPGTHRFWNESFYFNFFDVRSGIGGATRLGFSPNRGGSDGFLILYLPDGRVGFVRTHETLTAADHGREGQALVSGALRFVCLEPYRRWRIRYVGPIFLFDDPAPVGDPMQLAAVAHPTHEVDLDLESEALHPPVDFHAWSKKRLASPSRLFGGVRRGGWLLRTALAIEALGDVRAMSGASHVEQAIRMRGRVAVDGAVRPVEGFGQRDHSWGVRDMRVPSGWRWISAQFEDRFCFNATRVDVLGIEVSGGYAYREGRSSGLDGFVLHPEPDAHGRCAETMRLELRVADGASERLDVTILAQLPVAVDTDGRGTLVNECLARFRWNGVETLGIVEAMTQRFP